VLRQVRSVRATIAVAGAILLAAWVPNGAPSPRARPGWALYDRYCLPCHGSVGDGRGPAAPYTRGQPRDLARAEYAWRSTPLGQPPTDDDLRVTIRHGAPGTSMPGFDLTPAQIDQLVDVVKSFSPASFSVGAAPLSLGAPPAPDPKRGAELWARHGCGSCHGAGGAADGPAARTLARPPYDLLREPLRRPRAADDPESRRRAAALSIATGLASGVMPGYADALSTAELWALADHVVALGANANANASAAPTSATSRRDLDARTIAADRAARITDAGTWPGQGAPDEAAIFGGPIPPQGPPPAQLAPAQASLHPQQCARCHAKQAREWAPSRHAGAVSPGLAAQMFHLPPAEVASCLRCHAPLAEQLADEPLRADGVACAGCHVRGWTRHGPPSVAPSLLPIPGYPLRTLELYERGDFCLPCHQLPPRIAVAGRPLLDTYREWLEGPYMRRGVQCQHCHMPNREHAFLGVHDPDTFRQGIALTASARAERGVVTVVAELANVGAGHYLPTTPTPAAWLSIRLLDKDASPIDGAAASLRIGRDIYHDGTRWHERADTRIPPGERRTMAHAWTAGRTAEAAIARVTVLVHPDDYYERLYETRLAGKLVPARRALYVEALARAKRARYVALERDIAISGASSAARATGSGPR
jgi:mono/diheme cytochrome c family protein